MMTISSNHVVKVKREKLEACMTCPVCNELFREATTISECLHTCKSFFLSISALLGSDCSCVLCLLCAHFVDMGALFLRKFIFFFLFPDLGLSKFTFT